MFCLFSQIIYRYMTGENRIAVRSDARHTYLMCEWGLRNPLITEARERGVGNRNKLCVIFSSSKTTQNKKECLIRSELTQLLFTDYLILMLRSGVLLLRGSVGVCLCVCAEVLKCRGGQDRDSRAKGSHSNNRYRQRNFILGGPRCMILTSILSFIFARHHTINYIIFKNVSC